MARKALASLLILVWILLSGVELPGGGDLGPNSSVHKSNTAKKFLLLSLAAASSVSDDTIEKSNRTDVPTIKPSNEFRRRSPARDLTGQNGRVQKKNLQIYKRDGALLL